MNIKRAKHNLKLVQMTFCAGVLEKGKQRHERDSALAGRDHVALFPFVAQATPAQTGGIS